MKKWITIAALLVVFTANTAMPSAIDAKYKRGIIKVYVTIVRPDYSMPWQPLPPFNATGSAFILPGKKLITNAHIVSDARFIEIQKCDEARRWEARVKYVAHDCDLAILEPLDEAFFDGTAPAPLARELPGLDDEVVVAGYPMGGSRLSITRGVVSRIDYSLYVHSSVDAHLVLQVDAAINPGNSGGPVFFGNKVVGVAFSGLWGAENIGYAIPVPVITRFLDDIADAKYNGYPELGAMTFDMRNSALRKSLGLPDNKSGVAVCYIDPFGAAKDRLKPRDVLLSIDGHPITDDGTVTIGGAGVEFAEVMERQQWGATTKFGVWRDGREEEITVALTNPFDPFAFRNVYDERPKYLILGGLMFCPLTHDLLNVISEEGASRNAQELFYSFRYSKIDGLHEGRDEFVVMIGRLPHRVNTHLQDYKYGIVSEVNGVKIRNLKDLKKAAASPLNGFHVVRFDSMDLPLVMNAAEAAAANREVLATYAVPSPEFLGTEDQP